MKQLLAAVALTGCLSVPDGPPKECSVTADCDTANGEVCEEGTCWGNPPAGPFAALLTPPSKRKADLVAREMIIDGFPQDGFWNTFQLEQPVTFTGQIVCPNECISGELGATIVVTRPSSFIGGPLFRQVFETDPRTGTFQLVLPKVRAGEPDYAITVIPDGRQASTGKTSIAELVPPLRTSLSISTSQTGNTIDLGGEEPLLSITGTIVDAQDNPASNYRVVALGRWDLNAPLTEVSTVAFINQTDNQFTIKLAEGIIGPVELVAQPTEDTLQPTLRLSFNPLAAAAVPPKLVQPETSGAIDIPFLVQGTSTGGEVTGVVGAKVTIRGTLDGNTEATFVTAGDTNMAGEVSLRVPGGALASSYRISVVPQNNATVGVVFDRPLEPGVNTIKLPDRLAIAGTVLDAQGQPLKDVQVTANQSLRFLWSLGPIPQAFVAGIPAATTATLETGEFVLYVDAFIRTTDGELNDDVFGHYDISFVPSATTNAPLWSQLEVEIPRDPSLGELPLGAMPLPDAAHIHGLITDPFGELVEGAELILFRVEDPVASTLFCGDLTNAPETCPVPALQLGRGTSDALGMTRLTLPRF
jgi:hypothetical protein